MVQMVPELHGNHLFTDVFIYMAANLLSSRFFYVLFLSYSGKIWFSDRYFLITSEQPSSPPTAALCWVGAETCVQVSRAQRCLNLKESPLGLKQVDSISTPTATMTFPKAVVCAGLTSMTFWGGYWLVKIQTLSGLIVFKETKHLQKALKVTVLCTNIMYRYVGVFKFRCVRLHHIHKCNKQYLITLIRHRHIPVHNRKFKSKGDMLISTPSV